jgi:hypothetical protein
MLVAAAPLALLCLPVPRLFTMHIRLPFAALGLCLLFAGAALAAEPQIVSQKKIWDAGKHNAFTDLIRWRDQWYCTFREADGHVGGDGQLRVLVSADGDKWESAALIGEKGIDLRDPKLSVTPDDRLMIVAGGSVYEGKTLKGRQPRVTFSKDGRTWSDPQRVLAEGDWLWRVTWHGGKAYGISYDAAERTSPAAAAAAKSGKVEPGPADWKLKLVSSSDGVKYDVVTHLDVPGHPNEATLRFLPDGEMVALVRREGGNTFGWIGRSPAPYKEWTWKETKHRLGGPNFIQIPDGTLWAAGRTYPGGAKTAVARMTAEGDYEPVLTLASGGDTSYPGLVWHDGLLWMSYYSSHEGKTSIYLAKIKLPLEAAKIGSRLEPFVDGHLIERTSGSARLVVQRPTPREVVLTADAPWEGNTSAYYTVFQDGDTYRMYYRGSHYDEAAKKPTHREVTCYAESKDGIHWSKPELGLVEFNGSKQNNIVWDGEGTHCFTPFLDASQAAGTDARYKAVTRVKGGLIALKSADGIHWQRMAGEPVITEGAFDSQNLAFFDTHTGKYREYHRAFRTVRDIMTGTSSDFLHWTAPTFLDYEGTQPEHLYTNAVLPYPGAPHILVGFPTRFLPKTEATEPTFMVSRDGQRFTRYAEAIIPTSAPADRDGNRSNYLAWGVVELPGKAYEWSVYAKEAYYTGTGSRLRRFTYRRDGFVALTASADGGEAVTRPIRFAGKKLVLNCRAGQGGSVRVELQDDAGQPLDGLAAADCQPLAGDQLAAAVSWGQADLTAIADRPVRLRFVLDNAELFSFRFE